MDINTTFDEDDNNNSPPKLPDMSVGSSVSTELENEYNELLQYTLVVPASFEPMRFDEPKILENVKGLFSTKAALKPVKQQESIDEPATATMSDKEIKSDDIRKESAACSFFMMMESQRDEKKMMSSTENDFQFVKSENMNKESESETDSSDNQVKNPTNSGDLINFEHSIFDGFNKTENNVNEEEDDKTQQEEVQIKENETKCDEDKMEGQLDVNVMAPGLDKLNISSKEEQEEELGELVNHTKTGINSLTIISDITQNLTLNDKSPTGKVEAPQEVTEKPVEKTGMDGSDSSMSSLSPSSPSTSGDESMINHLLNPNSSATQTSPQPAPKSDVIDIEFDRLNLTDSLDDQSMYIHQRNKQSSKSNNQLLLENHRLDAGHDISREDGKKQANKSVKIASCMDKWYNQMKEHLLTEFDSRFEALQEQKKRLLEEKERHNSDIVKLKRELKLAKDSLYLREQTILKKDQVIDNLKKMLERQKEDMDRENLSVQWKLKQTEKAKESFMEKLAEKYHSSRMKLRAFMAWQNYLTNQRKLRNEKAVKKKGEEVCLELATKFQTTIKAMEEQLNASRQEVERQKVEISKYDEKIRKLSCVLSVEAMSILHDANLNVPSISPAVSAPIQHVEPPKLPTASTTISNSSQPGIEPAHHPSQVPQYHSQFAQKILHSDAAKSRSTEIKTYEPTTNTVTPLGYYSSTLGNYFPNGTPTKSSGFKLSDRESEEVAKHVKSYCERSFKKSVDKTSDASPRQPSSSSALLRAKHQLLNSANSQQEHQCCSNAPAVYETGNSEERRVLSDYDYEPSRKYEELMEHSQLPDHKSYQNKYSNVKAKVGSLPSSSNNAYSSVKSSKHLPSTSLYTLNTASATGNKTRLSSPSPYKSVIVEKHTSQPSAPRDLEAKSNSGQVRFNLQHMPHYHHSAKPYKTAPY